MARIPLADEICEALNHLQRVIDRAKVLDGNLLCTEEENTVYQEMVVLGREAKRYVSLMLGAMNKRSEGDEVGDINSAVIRMHTRVTLDDNGLCLEFRHEPFEHRMIASPESAIQRFQDFAPNLFCGLELKFLGERDGYVIVEFKFKQLELKLDFP